MKISKELLEQMENDDKAEMEELTPSEIAVYEEMENYSLAQRYYRRVGLRLRRLSWER